MSQERIRGIPAADRNLTLDKERPLILIVEDDPNISDMLITFLRTKQYRAIATPFGGSVVEICQNHSPHLILLDINLPDVNGYEVCRRLRDNLATRNTPIIFLTQKNQRDDRIVGLDSGADDYITKPFDMEELRLRINNAMRRARYQSSIDQASGLPSGPLVEEQLKTLLYRQDWALMVVGVENFSCFTGAYRHLKDKFASYVAQLLRQTVDEIGGGDDFVGRVGTVQFIIITDPARVMRLRARMDRVFRMAMDPSGSSDAPRPVTAQLYLSFGVITAADGPFGDVRSLAEAVMRSRHHTPPQRTEL